MSRRSWSGSMASGQPGGARGRLYGGRCANGKKLAERASHGRKRMLTDGCDSFSVVTVKPSESFWEAWDRIRTSADPDPLEVLQVGAAFSRYFDAAQKEAISFAALGWAVVGADCRVPWPEPTSPVAACEQRRVTAGAVGRIRKATVGGGQA